MSGDSVFLDTNILLYLLKGNKEIAHILRGKHFVISFITELEILSYPANELEMQRIKELLKECFIIDINAKIKENVPFLRVKYKLKSPDAIVCSTSMFLQLPLLTADKDLGKVEETNVVIYQF